MTHELLPTTHRASADALASAAGAVTIAAMVATPLLPRGGTGRRRLSSVVVVGSFVVTAANTARRWGAGRTATAATATVAITTVVERIGTRTGWPFGRYSYTDRLWPRVGGVPAIVPLAWFSMAVPARESPHAALGAGSRRSSRIPLGAAALTAWDLFLDPQMVGEGFWRWSRSGGYRGIPVSNFAGWFVTGLGVMALLEATLPTDRPAMTGSPTADRRLVGQYSYMAVMETVGFARYFRDPLVALVGAAGMLPVAGAAIAGIVRSR